MLQLQLPRGMGRRHVHGLPEKLFVAGGPHPAGHYRPHAQRELQLPMFEWVRQPLHENDFNFYVELNFHVENVL